MRTLKEQMLNNGAYCAFFDYENDFHLYYNYEDTEEDFSDYDIKNWLEIDKIRHEIAKNTITEKCLLTRAKEALDNREYDLASDLQLEIQKSVNLLTERYAQYKKNLL